MEKFGIFYGRLVWKNLVYFMDVWNVLWIFGIFYGRLVCFMDIWYTYIMFIYVDCFFKFW
jgi:hypothetical protein